MFNMDSFGDNCPTNWKEICDYLNNLNPSDFPPNGADEGIDRIWDEFCSGNLADCPEPIFE